VRRDGSFSLKVSDTRYVWSPVDVSVDLASGLSDRAGWRCDALPGLLVYYTHRAPNDRFDGNLPSTVSACHHEHGTRCCSPGSRPTVVRRVVYLHLHTSVDWSAPQEIVVKAAQLDGDRTTISDILRDDFRPPMPVPVLLEQHGDVWSYSKELTQHLRKVAKAEVLRIAGQEYRLDNKASLRACAKYLDTLRGAPCTVVAGMVDEEECAVHVHVVHPTGSASFNLHLVCVGVSDA